VAELKVSQALALTLPETPSALDDGLLTATEVAELKLNADWVVLSACNTAAGDKPGAEALSGLARSFFYAGAKTPRYGEQAPSRSLFVSKPAQTIMAREPYRGPARR
jgi:CHAT domain